MRESLAAFNSMVGEMGTDLRTMSANYKHHAEVNKRWEVLVASSKPVADGPIEGGK